MLLRFIQISLFLILYHFLTISLFANSNDLHIDPKKEIEILKSLDIDPNFMGDIHYIDTKENIDQLKKLYFLKTLKRGNLFMPNLHALLDEAEIPNTFLYMAMVESKFLADSKSHKHAAGLWQFMPATAKEYKLQRNRNIDERLDPIKSTQAAISYLKYLHERFGKWYLAAMAYNCGESRLARAIKQAGSDDLAVLLDGDYLPKETRNYIQRIIVAALLAHDKNIIKKNKSNHLFGYCSNKKLTKLYFKGGQSLKKIAVTIGVPYQKLKACNPHLIRGKLPPHPKKMYYLYLPEDLAKKAQERMKGSGASFVYYVQPNDTLFLISKRFNIKMSALKMLNPQLNRHKVLKIGMPLTILGKAPQKQQLNKIAKNRVIMHTLEHNTTLFAVSKKFNNKIALLKTLNPGIKEHLVAGEKIKVVEDINLSKTAKSTEANQTKTFHTVAINETNSSVNRERHKESNKTTQEPNRTISTKPAEMARTQKPAASVQQPALFRTFTHRIGKGESLDTIAKAFNMKIKDLFKEGNVIIFKIKTEKRSNTIDAEANITQPKSTQETNQTR